MNLSCVGVVVSGKTALDVLGEVTVKTLSLLNHLGPLIKTDLQFMH